MRLRALMLLPVTFLAPWAQADGLGRLFFTPAQRAQLDQPHARATAEESPPSISGIVHKHGGSRTVWINGVAQHAGDGHATDRRPIAMPKNTHPLTITAEQQHQRHAASGE